MNPSSSQNVTNHKDDACVVPTLSSHFLQFSLTVPSLPVWGLCLLLLFTSCIPARVPDNLDDTPGPPVIVDGQVYEGADFSVRYPAGWRIITSEASAPQSVVFAAPDNVAIIRLQIGSLEEASLDGEMRTEVRGVTVGDLQLTAIFSATDAHWDANFPLFESVLASVQPT